ncbi:hypothetical protein COF62_19970 [Bacillus toyonensis]|uniref:Uncharacterized protein n=1 Tax=Bacillus toyonensis TaxID=155322 RepID=A0AAP8JWI0_9BACI|nr:hypothetical protein CON81_23280 [Bacillus toyonensis]PHE10068.1 hypothetical protein COF62_19970 [Bacillus toyonensis]
MYVEQLRWLPAMPCTKPIHLPPTHFAFLEEGVFLAKMIKLINKDPVENTEGMDNIASYQLSSIYLLRALLSFLKDLRTRRKF